MLFLCFHRDFYDNLSLAYRACSLSFGSVSVEDDDRPMAVLLFFFLIGIASCDLFFQRVGLNTGYLFHLPYGCALRRSMYDS